MATLPETIKAITNLPKPILDAGANLISDLLGKPFQETGELISEQIYAWRWANRVRIADKASKKLEASGVASKVLPPGFLIPFLESCGNAEDSTLQDLWASLLASSVQDDRNQQALYRITLEGLSPGDAERLLSLRREEVAQPGKVVYCSLLPQRSPAPENLGGSEDNDTRLLALGLLTPIVTRQLQTVTNSLKTDSGFALLNYELSNYARRFLAVVGNDEFPWTQFEVPTGVMPFATTNAEGQVTLVVE